MIGGHVGHRAVQPTDQLGLAEQTSNVADQGSCSLLGLRDPQLQTLPSRGLHTPGCLLPTLTPTQGQMGPYLSWRRSGSQVPKDVINELSLPGCREISQRREKEQAEGRRGRGKEDYVSPCEQFKQALRPEMACGVGGGGQRRLISGVVGASSAHWIEGV